MNQQLDNLFEIQNNEVYIWIINCNLTKDNISFLSSFLSDDEILKASKFRFNKDKNCSVITRGVLRLLTSKYLKINPEDIKFKYGKFGKPDFDFDTPLKFNVSHAGDLAVIGFVNNYDIGIDVEYIKGDFDVLEIVDNYFSKQEIKTLNSIPKTLQTEAFYRGWTRKEAFIKGKSLGLSFPLDSFSISIDSDEKAKLTETLWDEHEKELWQIIPFKTEADYKAAVAIKGNIDSVKYFEFNLGLLGS
ncbi:4'-phosphopantetheinyl transferase superfamily protein [Algibacter sp. 2305UL17-15]|uniref:4'-phosphopantetheinyl transferase family protein n=1 Tax=Algibacter sp. 2305UL17-15 TaxID=3231268 RepID=UPI0034599AD8